MPFQNISNMFNCSKGKTTKALIHGPSRACQWVPALHNLSNSVCSRPNCKDQEKTSNGNWNAQEMLCGWLCRTNPWCHISKGSEFPRKPCWLLDTWSLEPVPMMHDVLTRTQHRWESANASCSSASKAKWVAAFALSVKLVNTCRCSSSTSMHQHASALHFLPCPCTVQRPSDFIVP